MCKNLESIAEGADHLFFATLATNLLAQDVVKEIADYLGHRATGSVEIYAKVDLKSLYLVAFSIWEISYETLTSYSNLCSRQRAFGFRFRAAADIVSSLLRSLGDMELSELTVALTTAYLNARPISPSTWWHRQCVIKRFFDQWVGPVHIPSSPVSLEGPKKTTTLFRTSTRVKRSGRY